MIELLKSNWIELLTALMGLIAVIVRLTPTEKDNDIFNFVKKILDFILPNFKKGGGTH